MQALSPEQSILDGKAEVKKLWLMLDSGVLYRNIIHNHLKLFNYIVGRIQVITVKNSL
jgi:hypothetical protein